MRFQLPSTTAWKGWRAGWACRLSGMTGFLSLRSDAVPLAVVCSTGVILILTFVYNGVPGAQATDVILNPNMQTARVSDDVNAVNENSLTISERFGISHPDQIVSFDGHIDSPFHLVASDGSTIHHQMLSNDRLAIRIVGGLHANETRRFRIAPGKAIPPTLDDTDVVSVREFGEYYELSNPLVGVRVPKLRNQARPYAPIQAVRLRDGNWAGAGLGSSLIVDLAGRPIRFTDLTETFIERGPLVVSIQFVYRILSPIAALGLGSSEQSLHRTTVTIQAGQPSIAIEEDTSNIDLQWSLDIGAALQPTQARYQGHHSTSVDNGREPDGAQYRPSHERPNRDAIVDLPFKGASPLGRFLTRWDPWAVDTGWYWQFYNEAAGPTANLVAIFQGRASSILGAHYSGVIVQSSKLGELILNSKTERRGPDARVYARNRYSWGLFSGTKEELRDPNAVQIVAQQMNLHAGINLDKIHRYILDFDINGTNGQGLYLSRSSIAAMIEKIRADETGPYGRGYYHHLYSAESSFRPLWQAWADRSGVKTSELAAEILERARKLIDSFVNGQGIYAFKYHYWHGGLEMSRDAVAIAHLISYAEQYGGQLSPAVSAKLRAVAALYAYLLWDDDYVPLFEHGQNLSLPNMAVQQNSYRNLLALMMSNHPKFKSKLRDVKESTSKLLRLSVNESGAAMGSNHYLQASMVPVLSAAQQLKMASSAEDDPFKIEPRLAKFGEYILQLQTPPEIRFGGLRKTVSFGDGSTESTEIYGQLGTAFREVDDALSEQLMWAWRRMGAPHSGFSGSSVLKIDENLPDRAPKLGSAHFPGALTVLRHGFGTGYETAAWLISGEFYRDHIHCDLGAVMLYALGAPIAVHWGSFYQPHVRGAWMQNVVVPEAQLKERWDSANVSTQDCFGNRNQTIVSAGLVETPARASAQVTLSNLDQRSSWYRTASLYYENEASPVLRIRDEFVEENEANKQKIFSIGLMASALLDAPFKTDVIPASASPQNPPAGNPVVLAPGVHRFSFKGQWGVDFDIVVVSECRQEVTITAWRHFWHPTRETDEYFQATKKKFEEAQHIFRLRGDCGFDVLLFPYRANSRPSKVEVVRNPDRTLSVVRDGSVQNFVN